jgi:hypothetical protein
VLLVSRSCASLVSEKALRREELKFSKHKEAGKEELLKREAVVKRNQYAEIRICEEKKC